MEGEERGVAAAVGGGRSLRALGDLNVRTDRSTLEAVTLGYI